MENNVLKHLKKDKRYTENQIEIIEAIENARYELQKIRLYFDMVKEPRLVDYAIYAEEAAKAKYMYLLNEARKNNIKLDLKYMVINKDIV